MPCTMTGSLAGDNLLLADEANERATKATQAACAAFKLLESNNIPLKSLSPEVQRWWRLHKKADGLDPNRDFIEIDRLNAGIED